MKKIIVLAICFALLTGLLTYAFLQKLEQPDEVSYEEAVVAVDDIPPYTSITAEMVAVKKLPEGAAHPKAAHAVSEVEGLVTESLILAEEQILPETLKVKGKSESGLSYVIPEGYRAYTISVDETTGVAWFLRRGDIVDVFADLADVPFEEKTESNGHVSLLLVEGCELAAVGTTTEAVKEEERFYASVTLLVTPEDAQRLTYAISEGKIHLALRGINDRSELELGQMRLRDIVPVADASAGSDTEGGEAVG
jgi:pilus assembly protein CpaB